MEKIKKERMIILGIMAGLVLLDLIFMIIKRYMTYSFNDWIYDNYGPNSVADAADKIKIDEPSFGVTIAAIVIIFIVWILFVGLALKYAISKSPKVQGRKWPYIILLIFAAIGIIMGAYTLFSTGKHDIVKFDDNVPAHVKNDIYSKIDNSYGIIYISNIISLVLELGILAANILAIVWIGKMKNEKDSQMTNEVLQTGLDQNSNDLP